MSVSNCGNSLPNVKGEKMAAPKTTQSPKSEETKLVANWKFLFKWLFIIGGLTAGVTNALSYQPDLLIWSLMVVGVIVGVFYFDSDDLINIGLRYLIFGAVANAIGGFYLIGSYLGAFFLGFFYYLGPVVLALVVVYFVKRYFLSK
jgi:hypothetical protein